jgi:hypothetical protein
MLRRTTTDIPPVANQGYLPRTALFIAKLPRNCRYFSIKVVAARKRIANAGERKFWHSTILLNGPRRERVAKQLG